MLTRIKSQKPPHPAFLFPSACSASCNTFRLMALLFSQVEFRRRNLSSRVWPSTLMIVVVEMVEVFPFDPNGLSVYPTTNLVDFFLVRLPITFYMIVIAHQDLA